MVDVAPETLTQFIMTDGAKNIADSMTKTAAQRANVQNEPEIQRQQSHQLS